MWDTPRSLSEYLSTCSASSRWAREPDCSLLSTADCFELVCLPIWLIAKGFSALPFAEELRSPGLVTSG